MSMNPPTTTTKKEYIPNKGQVGATYESVYQVLKRLNNLTLPRSMYRITTNGNVKIFLVKHKLIREISPEINLKSEYLTYRYYSIDTKGQDYIKSYEGFKELIS